MQPVVCIPPTHPHPCQVLAGMIGSSFGWRSPYLFIASLGMAAVYLVHIKGEEPVRGERCALDSSQT